MTYKMACPAIALQVSRLRGRDMRLDTCPIRRVVLQKVSGARANHMGSSSEGRWSWPNQTARPRLSVDKYCGGVVGCAGQAVLQLLNLHRSRGQAVFQPGSGAVAGLAGLPPLLLSIPIVAYRVGHARLTLSELCCLTRFWPQFQACATATRPREMSGSCAADPLGLSIQMFRAICVSV